MRRLLFFSLFFLLSACSVIAPARVVLETPNGQVKVEVEVADDEGERATGLMYRTQMDENRGMLFVFENAQPMGFWMKNTLIPLDMIFIDQDQKISSIQKNAIPCQADPCKVYSSSQPALYVLEVNAGFALDKGLQAGQSVTFENVK